MKITKAQLKQIIKEELESTLQEVGGSYQTPIEDIEDPEHAEALLQHLRSSVSDVKRVSPEDRRAIQNSINQLLQRFPELAKPQEEPMGEPKE